MKISCWCLYCDCVLSNVSYILNFTFTFKTTACVLLACLYLFNFFYVTWFYFYLKVGYFCILHHFTHSLFSNSHLWIATFTWILNIQEVPRPSPTFFGSWANLYISRPFVVDIWNSNLMCNQLALSNLNMNLWNERAGRMNLLGPVIVKYKLKKINTPNIFDEMTPL